MTDQDIVIEQSGSQELLEIINTQLTIITTLQETNDLFYDKMEEQKIRVMSNAFDVILIMQERLKELV